MRAIRGASGRSERAFRDVGMLGVRAIRGASERSERAFRDIGMWGLGY